MSEAWYTWNISEIGDLFVDVADLPEGLSGTVQLMFLGGIYFMVLMYAADMISEGSELLLLVPSLAGIVGSVVLPVLGAVPDGAIVLFSGLGPDAQNQLNVGVGALAGSTVMLLTIPWFLSIYAGRVNIVNGKADYRGKLNPSNNSDLMNTGVGISKNVNFGAYIMMVTCVSYLLLQVPAVFAQLAGEPTWGVAAFQHGYSGVGLILSFSFFFAYLWYQYKSSLDGSDEVKQLKRDEVMRDAMRDHKVGLRALVYDELETVSGTPNEKTSLKSGPYAHLKTLLKPFFHRYDMDRNGFLDIYELKSLFKDLNETPSADELKQIFSDFDKDKSGQISFDEFILGVASYVKKTHHKTAPVPKDIEAPSANSNDDDDEEEHEEIPEDLADLSPAEQQKAIKTRAAIAMAIGTVFVILFSDPMVDVLNEMGNRSGVPPFYVSFILAPLAANLSEVMASCNYAAKKTQKNY
jgi:Ca2+/Na+ antiporter